MTERFAIAPRRRFWTAVLPDALLAALWLWMAVAGAGAGRLRWLVLVAVPVVLAWEIAGLSRPRAVEIDDEGVRVFAWGRAHVYRWAEVEGTVRLRVFSTRDRALLRLGPFHPFRGRYWLGDDLEGWPRLLDLLQRRSTNGRR